MCRFIGYVGTQVDLQFSLIKAENALIVQSKHAKKSSATINGDGCGLGWYSKGKNSPAIYRSTSPAWNDLNFMQLSDTLRASCFIGHVRAATDGIISFDNCQPFCYMHFLMTNNGDIAGFEAIKHEIAKYLSKEMFSWIKGGTDSEYFFALFWHIAMQRELNEVSQFPKVMALALNYIKELQIKFNIESKNINNVLITNGESLFSARFAEQKESETLYVLKNEDGAYIVSEPFFDDRSWKEIKPNHFCIFDKHDLIHGSLNC